MKKRFSFSKIFVYLVLVVIILFFTVTTDTFLTSKNILNICRQISMIGICSVGMTMVLLTGGIDISVGSVVAFTGIVMGKLIVEAQVPFIIGMLAALVIGRSCSCKTYRGSRNGDISCHADWCCGRSALRLD